jgi:hypothetical protein
MARDATWFRRNDDYLAAGLVLLRHRLNSAFAEAETSAPGDGTSEARHASRRGTSWFRNLVGGAETEQEAPILLPAAEGVAPLVEEKRLADALAEAGEGEPPPALVGLARTFGLSDFERDLLLLCLAVELDPRLAERMPAGGRPTFSLATAILPEPTWGVLAPDSALRHWGLIEVDQSAGRPLTASPLRIDERILNHVKGLDHLDARLGPLVRPVPALEEELPDSLRETANAVEAALDPAAPAVAVLRGSNRASSQDIAGSAARQRGLGMLRLAAEALPSDAGELDRLARLWHRETLLGPVALLLEAYELDTTQGAEAVATRVSRFVGRSGGGIVIAARDGVDLPLTPLVDRAVARPTPTEQLAAWRNALQGEPSAAGAAAQMAARFDLEGAAIAATVRAARADESGRPLAERLRRAALARTRSGLSRLAERVDVKAAFGEIVLPEAQEAQLRQIVDHLEHRITVIEQWGFGERMNRGLGVSALFAGESGTGKTMAAEVVAQALGLDLYRIDLSAVVSKYIGETEKNLSRLFDAADLGGAVLLFDEADALFGKRSEVKDSHDRFANIEIDYLLQRMEAYRGVAILTTNMKSAIDPAFMRRLRFVVDFPYPGPSERRRIWEHALPAAVPRGDIDLDRVARLDLTGAAIQAVALNAAFLAAARGAKVSNEILLEASRAEFRKFGRPVSESDFRARNVA